RGAIPDRLVPGIDRDADSGYLPDPDPAPAVEGATSAYRVNRHLARGAGRGPLPRPRPVPELVRIRAAFLAAIGYHGCSDGGLSLGGRSHQAIGNVCS